MHNRIDRTTHHRVPGLLAGVLAAAAVFMAGPGAHANINLELRAVNESVFIGAPVDVQLFAVSDNLSTQTLSALDVIIGWDPMYLTLLGLNNSGSPLSFSGFIPGDPYGLNASLTDGDALWTGFAPLGAPVGATPAGTLLTTFRFTAVLQSYSLAPTPPPTLINILATAGNPPGHTIVYSGVTPNTNVTGTLSGAAVTIVPAPAAAVMLIIGLVFRAKPRARRREQPQMNADAHGSERRRNISVHQ